MLQAFFIPFSPVAGPIRVPLGRRGYSGGVTAWELKEKEEFEPYCNLACAWGKVMDVQYGCPSHKKLGRRLIFRRNFFGGKNTTQLPERGSLKVS
jgi:hypothetical protein